MKVLSVSITFCMIFTLSCAIPFNFTVQSGQCVDQRQNCKNSSTSIWTGFCPKCDDKGNFLPVQCSASTGFCWCVNVTSGLQIPDTTKPRGTVPDCDRDSHDCPDGWSSFGKRCLIFIDSPKSWVDAEVYCQFDKGNLASVHSQKENLFIMSLTGGDTNNFPQTWLGGFDAIQPGYWRWSDGSNFNYRNWFDGNPHHDDNNSDVQYDNEEDEHNNHDEGLTSDQNEDDHDNHDHETHDIYDVDGNKNCLKMNYEHDLQWFYASCHASLPFVCVKNIRP